MAAKSAAVAARSVATRLWRRVHAASLRDHHRIVYVNKPVSHYIVGYRLLLPRVVNDQFLVQVFCVTMANLTLRYLDELSYVLNSRRHLANQAKASSVGDLLNAEEERFTPVCLLTLSR